MTAVRDADAAACELTLYVAGASEFSARAITDARALCDVSLDGRCRLTVVNVHEDAAAALSSQVIAIPTLVRNQPMPERRVVGNLSNTEKVLGALDLHVAEPLGQET
jgi:circadian clock protein KaiB